VEWIRGEVFRVGRFPGLCDVPERSKRKHHAAAIVADAADDAYIAGTTTAPGYPTVAALVPNQLVTTALGTTSGFLTKLTPAGDGIPFSTFIPARGQFAGDRCGGREPAAGGLDFAGTVSGGQRGYSADSYDLSGVAEDDARREFRAGIDGACAGDAVVRAAGASGTAWVDGSLIAGLPLLPLMPLSTIGNSFAVRVNAANLVDQTARFGGIAASNPNSASAPVALTSVAIDASATLWLAAALRRRPARACWRQRPSICL